MDGAGGPVRIEAYGRQVSEVIVDGIEKLTHGVDNGLVKTAGRHVEHLCSKKALL